MASNVELITSIVSIDPGAKTDGLSNEKLAALLKEVKTKAEKAKDSSKKTEEKPPPYQVAKGKAITGTRRYGIIGEGAEVTKDMVQGGKDTLDALVKRELVIKN